MPDPATAIREAMEAYANAPGSRLRLNPDADIVNRVLAGLAARERKTGMRLCPCRLGGATEAENQKIVCPCVYHLEELARDGQCHCRLFVSRGE